MSEQPPPGQGMIAISQDSVVEVLRAQRNAALDDSANWKAAYIGLVQTNNETVTRLQQENIDLQDLLRASGYQQVQAQAATVPGLHAVPPTTIGGDAMPAALAEGLPEALNVAEDKGDD